MLIRNNVSKLLTGELHLHANTKSFNVTLHNINLFNINMKVVLAASPTPPKFPSVLKQYLLNNADLYFMCPFKNSLLSFQPTKMYVFRY